MSAETGPRRSHHARGGFHAISRPRLRMAVGVLSGAVAVGCSTAGPGSYFLHTHHRGDFALDVPELKHARFYVNQDILGRTATVDGEAPGTEPVVLVTVEDIGRVIGGGPDWLLLTFGRGSGIAFMTDEGSGDAIYYLATQIVGEPGLSMVKDLDEPSLFYAGQRFEIALGSDARLLIDSDDLRDLLERRAESWTEGRYDP